MSDGAAGGRYGRARRSAASRAGASGARAALSRSGSEPDGMTSPGIVRVLEGGSGRAYPGLPWEPKQAFTAVAESYRG
jgi:hypothetical protein